MLIIGHKGSNDLVPGNTIEAIKRALEFKVDMIEVDIRVTKDNVAILSHDEFITSNGLKLKISDSTYKDLLSSYQELTTLEDALKVSKHTKILLDIKPGEKIEPIMRVIASILKNQPEKILIASFDFKLLQNIHNKYPEINLAVTERWSGVRAGHRARNLGTKILIMNQLWLWSGFISSLKGSGYQLYAYTLNNPNKALKWKKYGLAGVITDCPDRF